MSSSIWVLLLIWLRCVFNIESKSFNNESTLFCPWENLLLAKKTMACQQEALLKGKALSFLACLNETFRLLETKHRSRKEAVSLWVCRKRFFLTGWSLCCCCLSFVVFLCLKINQQQSYRMLQELVTEDRQKQSYYNKVQCSLQTLYKLWNLSWK